MQRTTKTVVSPHSVERVDDECEFLVFSLNVLQVIFSYLLNDIFVLKCVRSCLGNFILDSKISVLSHYCLRDSLRETVNGTCDMIFDQPKILLTEEETRLFIQTVVEKKGGLDQLLFSCARKGIYPNLTQHLLAACSFETKLMALEMIGFKGLDIPDVIRYDSTILVLISHLWAIDESRTQISLDSRIANFRGENTLYVDHFLAVIGKYDKNAVQRNANGVWHIVSYAYLERLVQANSLNVKQLYVKVPYFSTDENSEDLLKFFYLLKEGAQWSTDFSVLLPMAGREVDRFYREFLETIPFHPILLCEEIISLLAYRMRVNPDLLERFVQTYASHDAQHQKLVQDSLQAKDSKVLYKLYQDVVDFYSKNWTSQSTWKEVLDSVIPRLRPKKSKLKRKAYDIMKMRLREEEKAKSVRKRISTLRQLLRMRKDALITFLENSENRNYAESVACSSVGLEYLRELPQKTVQLKLVFDSLSANGRNLFVKTLCSDGYFDWIDYLLA